MAECKASGITNDQLGSRVDVPCNCDVIWSAAHAFSYGRLSEDVNPPLEFDLLDCYYTRARRIAGTYANFYLENEPNCDKDKLGRFYWLAFGAFASKQVSCVLGSWQVESATQAGMVVDVAIPEDSELEIASEAFGVGNLWLFMDVATWHWAYVNYPKHYFEGMGCFEKRDAQKLLDNSDGSGGVHTTVTKNLEWADYALGKINDLKPTDYIRKGMKGVEKIENAPEKERADDQMDHLQHVANHEQLEILQKLIYNHPGFANILSIERDFRGWIDEAQKRATEQGKDYAERLAEADNWLELAWEVFSPAEHANIAKVYGLNKIKSWLLDYELVYSAECTTLIDELKTVAPKGMELEKAGTLADAQQENPKTRMGWIGKAAEKFHEHMIDRTSYMHGELEKMAGWIKEPDFSATCVSMETINGAFK